MKITTACWPLLASLVTATTTLSAQTAGAFEPEITALVMEAKIDLANIKTPAPLPAALTGLVSSGLLEFRSRIDKYDPISRTARTTLFLAGAGTAIPTADAGLPGATDATMVSQSTIRFETVVQSKGTWTGVGHFVNFIGGALPVPPGTIFTTSFGYAYGDVTASGASTAGFSELSFVIPGAFNVYSTAPVGSISVTVPASGSSANRSAN